MSYFDHVQCHSCGARMDPEKLVPGRGEMPACPYCNANLNLADLFGVKDAFVGLDDGLGNDHTLDDLVGGELYDSRYPDGRPPAWEPPPQRQQASPARSAPAARQAPAGRPAPRGLSGPTASMASAPSRPNALVPSRRSAPEPDDRSSDGAAPRPPTCCAR